MGRMLVGMAIASSIATVDEGHGARRGGHAPAPANDQGNGRLVNRDIGVLLAAEYRALIMYSRRLTANGPEAADLVHMVCARVLSQQTPIENVENLSGWLRTALFHAFIDLRRRARWEIPTDSAVLERPTATQEAELEEPDITMDDVRAILLTIPAHFRVPYELFTFEHMPYARIATVLGLSLATVGTRINRARERLRRSFRKRYGA